MSKTLDRLQNCKSLDEAERLFDYGFDAYKTRDEMVQNELNDLIKEFGEPANEKQKELYENFALLKVEEARHIFEREKNLAFSQIKSSIGESHYDYNIWMSIDKISESFDGTFIGKMIDSAKFIEEAIDDFIDFSDESEMTREKFAETLKNNFGQIVAEHYVKTCIGELEKEMNFEFPDSRSYYDYFRFYQGENDFSFYDEKAEIDFKKALSNGIEKTDNPKECYENLSDMTKGFLDYISKDSEFTCAGVLFLI